MTGAAIAARILAGSVGGITRSTAVPRAALSGSARSAARDLLLVDNSFEDNSCEDNRCIKGCEIFLSI